MFSIPKSAVLSVSATGRELDGHKSHSLDDLTPRAVTHVKTLSSSSSSSERRAAYKARKLLIENEGVFDVEEEAAHFPVRQIDIDERMRYYEFEIERELKIKEGLQKLFKLYDTGSRNSLMEERNKTSVFANLTKTPAISRHGSQNDLTKAAMRPIVSSKSNISLSSVTTIDRAKEDTEDRLKLCQQRLKAFEELLGRLKIRRDVMYKLSPHQELEISEEHMKRLDALNEKLFQLIDQTDFREDYELGEVINKGFFATVYKGVRKKSGGVVLIKQTRSLSLSAAELIVSEISALRGLSSPNIIQTHGYYFNGETNVLNIVTECFEGTPLGAFVLKHALTEDQIAFITSQVLKGLAYLHSNGIAHKDLKASNIFLGRGGSIKISDGLLNASQDSEGFTGSMEPYWLAPEVIQNKGKFVSDIKADIWSLGITMIELAETYPPHCIDSLPFAAAKKICQNPPPCLRHQSLWTRDFNDFLNRCLRKEVPLREDTEQLLKHRFIESSKGVQSLQQMLLIIERDSELQPYM